MVFLTTSGWMVGCQPTMAGHSRTSPGHPRVAPATMERTRRHSCDRPADILTTDNKLVEIQFIFNHLWKTCTAYHTCIPHTPAYNSRALTFSDYLNHWQLFSIYLPDSFSHKLLCSFAFPLRLDKDDIFCPNPETIFSTPVWDQLVSHLIGNCTLIFEIDWFLGEWVGF